MSENVEFFRPIHTMDIQEVLKLADHLVFNHTGKHLDNLQKTILEGVLEGKKYSDIAGNIPYSEGYVRDIASEVWKILSTLSGEEINKSNFKSAIERLHWSVSSKIANFGNVGINKINNKLNICRDRTTPSKNNQPLTKTSADSTRKAIAKEIRDLPNLGELWGRENELLTLEHWILQENTQLIGILGISGIGKTTLSRHLLEKIKNNFDYIIWKNLYHAPPLSILVKQLISSLSDQTELNLSLPQRTDPDLLLHLDTEGLLSLFNEYLEEYRCLIILDNLQHILAESKITGNYKDEFTNYSEFFKNISQLSHRSCLVFNSWESPLDIINLTGTHSPVKLLPLTGLTEAATEIFKQHNLLDEEKWQNLINAYSGNPYWLKIASRMIQELFNGKVKDFLNYNSLFIGDEMLTQLNQQFQKLSLLEQEVMLKLSQIKTPITIPEILQHSSCSPPELFLAIQSLVRRSLIEKNTQDQLTFFTISPVIRECIKRLNS